jgi:hypothetical protein
MHMSGAGSLCEMKIFVLQSSGVRAVALQRTYATGMHVLQLEEAENEHILGGCCPALGLWQVYMSVHGKKRFLPCCMR